MIGANTNEMFQIEAGLAQNKEQINVQVKVKEAAKKIQLN